MPREPRAPRRTLPGTALPAARQQRAAPHGSRARALSASARRARTARAQRTGHSRRRRATVADDPPRWSR
eukprot:11162669-Lingulodinium_polyedra.AAC.1